VVQIGWLDDSDADRTPTVSGEFHQISQEISQGQEKSKPSRISGFLHIWADFGLKAGLRPSNEQESGV